MLTIGDHAAISGLHVSRESACVRSVHHTHREREGRVTRNESARGRRCTGPVSGRIFRRRRPRPRRAVEDPGAGPRPRMRARRSPDFTRLRAAVRGASTGLSHRPGSNAWLGKEEYDVPCIMRRAGSPTDPPRKVVFSCRSGAVAAARQRRIAQAARATASTGKASKKLASWAFPVGRPTLSFRLNRDRSRVGGGWGWGRLIRPLATVESRSDRRVGNYSRVIGTATVVVRGTAPIPRPPGSASRER